MARYDIPTRFKGATFLVDTNFFIDSYSHGLDFKDFIAELKKHEIELTSSQLVKFEFIRSNTLDVVRLKTKWYEELVGFDLPLDPKIYELAENMIGEYGQYMKGLPLIDLIMAAYLKKYKTLYLLTRDHKDFPTTVFKRDWVFTIESVQTVWAYGLYLYRVKSDEDEIPF